mmetsp:Transcript_2394/g.7397  ORF Transcript_2394/g.7397 Transcript_2394/m.7397 type:complete len:215 (+) Transcript_2394:338-982(+)
MRPSEVVTRLRTRRRLWASSRWSATRSWRRTRRFLISWFTKRSSRRIASRSMRAHISACAACSRSRRTWSVTSETQATHSVGATGRAAISKERPISGMSKRRWSTQSPRTSASPTVAGGVVVVAAEAVSSESSLLLGREGGARMGAYGTISAPWVEPKSSSVGTGFLTTTSKRGASGSGRSRIERTAFVVWLMTAPRSRTMRRSAARSWPRCRT